MKKGWETKSLGELCRLLSGQHIEAKDYNAEGRGIGYLTGPSDFGPLHPVVTKWTEHPKVMAANGDILITVKGSGVGKINLLDQDEVAISRQLMAVRVTNANSRFVHAFLSSAFDHFQSLSTGAAIPGISRDQVLGLEIAVPPLAEQQRIVGVLDEAFACLATAQANAEKNLQNARALFESHLQSVFTHRGKGWEQKRIPDVCITFGRGKSRHRPRNEPSLYGGDYPFIQTGDLSNADHVITTYTQTYSAKGLAQSKLWPKGTVGIAIVGATIGETGILGFDGCFPDSIIGMNVDPKKADPFFIEYMLQHFKETVKSQGEGSARENINLATFDRLVFPIPPIVDQHLIVKKFDLIKKETQRLESLYQQKQAALSALKKSLLHQAFSGEL